jgi:hypothetical protein
MALPQLPMKLLVFHPKLLQTFLALELLKDSMEVTLKDLNLSGSQVELFQHLLEGFWFAHLNSITKLFRGLI